MPTLSEEDVSLLFEIYGLPRTPYTVTIGEYGFSQLQPYLLVSTSSSVEAINIDKPAIEALVNSIFLINQSSAQVIRVKEILVEYKELSLDASNINVDGYHLRPNKNIKNLVNKLYPYTGLIVKNLNRMNSINMG